MRKIGFIGAFDKTDLMLNIAKILTTMDLSVLIVDSSIDQKARYIVPAISPTVSYITYFENIDVAVGFKSEEEIKRYTGEIDELPYDIALIDCDTFDKIDGFNLENSYKNYFVTAFDMYSLRKGLEALSNLRNPIQATKILFAKEESNEEDEYLNYLSMEYRVQWEEEKIYFQIENGDWSVTAENQRLQKIRFKNLSMEYKENLIFIVKQIIGEENENAIRKTVKNIEKGA